MRAFHNDAAVKKKYVNRVVAHQKADELVRGATGQGGRGCAVWCTLDAYDHSRYPIELGIPEWLARVEDTLFENMSVEKSKAWPAQFLKAINVGADLEKAKNPFLIKILESTLNSMKSCKYDKKAAPQVTQALAGSTASVKQMIKALKTGKGVGAAESAADAAADAARSAALSAARSAAWNSAWSAAESAARSAADAARSAALSAAESAADAAADAARSAALSAAAAWSAAYNKFASDLLTILRGIT